MRKLINILVVSSILAFGFIGRIQAQESIIITASDSTAQSRALYTVQFLTSESLSPDAVIKVVFPKEYILSKKILAGSHTIKGGLVTTVKGDTVLVQRTGLGKKVLSGTYVDVMLSDIINPAVAGDMYQISIMTQSDRKATSKKIAQVPVSVKAKPVAR
jgi:hypothetical protein